LSKLFCIISAGIFFFAGCSRKEETALINEGAAPITESALALNKEQTPSLASAAVKTADELGHNPFLSREEEREFADVGKAVPIEYLTLSAIFYSTTGQSKAIINGRILQIGSTIDGKEITQIRPKAVILKDVTAEYILRLKNIAG
jgi:hypothetical protein